MAGNIFVISAPSGTGKTTIVKKLLNDVPNLVLAVSYTTRFARPQEKDGVDYFFVDKVQFKEMVRSGGFIEWAEVHGQTYGTPKKEVEESLAKGLDVLLDIDTQGAAKVKQKYPDAVLVFLLPPSFDELERRLRSRGTNTEEDVEKRIENAREEYVRRHEYDYQVVNDELEEAFDEVVEIIDYYRGELED
jgi:guanylate kinase